MAEQTIALFTGNANPALAHDIARHLTVPLGRASVGRFSDGEVMVEILENVRGKDCFVLQSTCAPTNDNLVEILLMVDALKRASAARVTAAMIEAVSRARFMSLDAITANPVSLSAARRACSRPRSVRSMSACPCHRPRAFHSLWPWRSMRKRVGDMGDKGSRRRLPPNGGVRP